MSNDLFSGISGKTLALLLVAVTVCCWPSAAARQAETYRTGLEARAGQEAEDLMPLVTKDWKFELLEEWKAENPTPEAVRKHDRRDIRFSAEDLKDLFAAPGTFRTMIFVKPIGSSSPRAGEINELGSPTQPDSRWEVRAFAVIRLVFRDGRLVHYRIWPKLEESSFSPGIGWRRSDA